METPTTQDLSQQVDNILKCIMCSAAIRQRIYTCENEHLHCNDCIDDLNIEANIAKIELFGRIKCSICQKNVNTRAYLLEFLSLELVRNPTNRCKWEKNGCEYREKTLYTKKSHEMTCAKRDFPCPMKSRRLCTWKGKLNELQNHIKAHENITIINIEQTTENDEQYTYTRTFKESDITKLFDSTALIMPINLLVFQSEPEIMFFIDISCFADHWCLTPKYIGPPDLRENFITTLSIEKCNLQENRSNQTITVSDNPAWYTIESEYLLISSSTITLKSYQMKKFQSKNEFLRYKLVIKPKTK